MLYSGISLYSGHHRTQLAVLYTVGSFSIDDTIGTQLAVLYTVGSLSIEDTIGTQLAVLYREVSLILK